MPLDIVPLSPEELEYLAALAEVNPDSSGVTIHRMMSEAFPREFSLTIIQRRLAKIRGPRLPWPTKKDREDFFAFVAENSHLSFRKLAPLYSEKTGMKMDYKKAERWYNRVIADAARNRSSESNCIARNNPFK